MTHTLKRWLDWRLLATPEAIVLALFPIVLWAGHRLSPNFLDLAYQLDATSLYAEVGLMALAMTFIIVSGNIDLSIASNLALTGVVCAKLYALGMPFPLALALMPVLGGLLGMFNGLLITWLRLPSLTVTLGTLALYRGLAQVVAGDASLGSFPDWFVGIDYRYVTIREVGVPYPLLFVLALAVLAALVLHRTTFGRAVFAMGTSEPAALYSGLRVNRVKVALFTLSGAAAGLGAAMMLSRLSVARYDLATGDTSELAVITAVVLGGTSIFGGRGTIFGTVAALLLLGLIRQAMGLNPNITPDAQRVVNGTLLITAVLLAQGVGLITRRRPKPKATVSTAQ